MGRKPVIEPEINLQAAIDAENGGAVTDEAVGRVFAGGKGEGITVEAKSGLPGDDDVDDITTSRPRQATPTLSTPASDGPAAEGGDDLLPRLTSALEVIAKKQATTESTPADSATLAGAMALLANAIERMTEGQMRGAQMVADATRRGQQKENQFPPRISSLNPRGDKDFPRPQLKCEMMVPHPLEQEVITREEIELYNLLQPGEFLIKRNDDTRIKVTVRIITKLDSDVPSRLILNHDTAFNNDHHRLMPPISNFLRQILKQTPKSRDAANRVLTMEEEEAFVMAGQLNSGETPADGGRAISFGE